MNIKLFKIIIVVSFFLFFSPLFAAPNENKEAKLHKFNSTIEKERPVLDEKTKSLISAYRRNPSEAKLKALRTQIEINYDRVLDRKKEKLAELKQNARHISKVQEMQDIVTEMVRDRENRIEQSMRRFIDPRLKPGARSSNDGFLPVLGAGQNIFIAYTPVTNEDYSKFVKATGQKAPRNWLGGVMPSDKAQHPVVNVSYDDAVAYCKWLTEQDGKAMYRLPTAKEWEYAAGHMPKDADFNCGENNATTPVDAYSQTLSACGAIDMWGNSWELTSTKVEGSDTLMIIKGGSWRAPRMSCRSEQNTEARDDKSCSDDVGFRILRVK